MNQNQGKPLRVLIVEDVESDAVLLMRELTRGGFAVTYDRVDTLESMTLALSKQTWDIVISDYSMPQFSAPRALALVKEQNLDIPFIIVSGTVNEILAVEVMRAGARDFMAKGNFARMIPAVERELTEAKGRAERAQMQEQLLISDRMASMGTLAAGVAHEINNPLASVMAHLHFAAEDISSVVQNVQLQLKENFSPHTTITWITERLGEIGAALQDAHNSAERIRLIVRDLKIFSRSDEQKIEAVDVHQIIESSIRIALNEIRHRAVLVKDFGNIPLIKGNAARLGQVFLNLIVNAAQAIPEGNVEKNEIRVSSRKEGKDSVAVEIHDTGVGIPEHLSSKIFDPFFTTKPIGIGTGLGLSICHRIIADLGGIIQVESKINKGTLIRVVLPISTNDIVVDSPTCSTPALTLGRRPILVVDDDPALGIIIRRILSSHDVLVVTSAQAALDFINKDNHFDIIFCDLMMPQMTGIDLYDEISKNKPEIAKKMVFMTGGAFTDRAKEFLEQVQNEKIDKPFNIEKIQKIVKKLLKNC